MGDTTGEEKESISTDDAQDAKQPEDTHQEGVKEEEEKEEGGGERQTQGGGAEGEGNGSDSNNPDGREPEPASCKDEDAGEIAADTKESGGDDAGDVGGGDEGDGSKVRKNHADGDHEDNPIDAVSEVNKMNDPAVEKEDVENKEIADDANAMNEVKRDGYIEETVENKENVENLDDDVGDSISVRGTLRDIANEEDDASPKSDLTTVDQEYDREIEPSGENRRSSMKSAKSSKKTKTVRVRSSKTVSSIEVDMTRIIRSEDDDYDDDDDDAVTRVTCGKSVDFSIPVDEVDEELQRVIDRPGSGRTSMMDNEDMVGLGRAATMNTPVTTDGESFVYQRSVRTPSRDGMYQHAVNLIHNRCRSQSYSTRSQPQARRRGVVRQQPPPRSAASLPETIPTTLLGGVPMFNLPNVVKHINQDPFTDQPNSYFYIAQSKPLPMKPMKVWKGYRGNVYFEPMVCRRAPFSTPSTNQKPRQRSMSSSQLPDIHKSTKTKTDNAAENSTRVISHSATTSRSQATNGRRSMTSGAKSALSTHSTTGRQLSILDKTAVLSRMDYNAAEDIKWISGIESTGTLQIGPSGDKLTGRAYKVYRNGDKHPKLRIRRGLVSHNLAGNNKNSPKFGVSGGRINEDLKTNHNSNPTNRTQHRTAVHDNHNANHSYPTDRYQSVDSMTALQQIMKRNDGRGRSKLVHILPSAYGDAGAFRVKGK